ncbi:MAG TPA: DUF6600 domain-containing protein [Stellaceae bacterium]|jgi:hypothetical protein
MRRVLLALPVSLLLLTPVLANAADPPARVGRLSYIDGTVSFHPAGQQGDWSPATVNYPVTTGESFWTDANARAAVEIGPAELRLDQASELDVTRLDDSATDLQLDQGALNLHLAQAAPGGITITTPSGRILVTTPGDYDINTGQPDNDQPSGQVVVSVFNGAAKFESDRGAVDIAGGQAAVISGDPIDVQLAAATPSDFDQWADDQEHREDLAKLPQAVPPAMTGYQDLAAYGSWSDDPDYGQVWYPSDMPSGWAPYRDGHWAWVDPWGWTWIDDAPWGFAPFHYGRWIDRDDRWAWIPQDIPPQPVYAPALVAFVGGDGWGVDLGAGAAVAAIGWVALAPHEVYHPQFRASETFNRRINGRDWNAQAFAARNATLNNFHNRQAATVVPTAAFTHAAPVQRARVTVAADQLTRARASGAAVTGLQPSAFARAGRADPQAATAMTPRANAQANVARGRVPVTTPAALAQEKAPTAPGPHRVAEAARPNRASAPANAAVAPNATQEQQNVGSTNNAARAHAPNEAAGTVQQTPQRNEAPNTARGAGPVWQQRGDHANVTAAPTANANLAPHPAPPSQAAREVAPVAPNTPNAPARRDLAQHPAPPQLATQPRAERAAPEHAALPHENAPPHPALAPAGTSTPRPETQRTAPPAHVAAPPQVAHAPAPMPPLAVAPPRQAAPPPTPHPAALPAPHPPAAPVPRPAAAPAPHPVAAPAPRPAPAPHPPAAPAPHPAAAPAPHPVPAPPAHPAPAAKAVPAQPEKKDQPH